MRKSVNVLLCLAALVAIGRSGREIWQVWDGRRQIDAACAGLVPAGRVLALSPAGGRITHREADEGVIEIDRGLGAGSAQDCEIFSTEAGEKDGEETGGRWFFTGAVGVLPANRPLIADGPLEDLVDSFGGPTHPDQPLGGDIAGWVTESDVVVQLPCAEGRVNGREVTALWARASLQNPGRRFTVGGQLSADDRDILAETAVITANNLAGRLGCTDRLPDPPDNVPALPEGPVPAARAEGTCAWYGKTGLARRSGFPDQVVESRTDDRLWDQRCGLVLSEAGRAPSTWPRGASAASAARSAPDGGSSPCTPTPGRRRRPFCSPAPTFVRSPSPRHPAGPDAAPRTRSGGRPPSATGSRRSTP
ncbi:hypothetical protein LV779_38720 [Streptomyces thinghirensis]|nr:hypothetical protein [Streptomyces thinghirensis]